MQSAAESTGAEDSGRVGDFCLPSPGTTIDERYRIVRAIASGGMGAVFEAESISVGWRCAVKFLRRELAARSRSAARFEREARLLGRLQHEHLTAVLDYGLYLGRSPFLVMEYLGGVTLQQLLKERGRLPAERAMDLLEQLARGMAYVHAKQIVHRDLKPENLMVLERSDGRDWVKILDFGIARALEDDSGPITRSGAELGTAQYMSPEQARGAKEITPRADVYSMGAVAYEMLTGTRVHPGDSYNAVIFQLLTHPHRPLLQLLPECPPAFAAIVERCLEKDANRRFSDAAALRDALAGLAETPRQGARSASVHSERRSGRPAGVWLASAALAGALTTLAVAGLRSRSLPRSTVEIVAPARPPLSPAAALAFRTPPMASTPVHVVEVADGLGDRSAPSPIVASTRSAVVSAATVPRLRGSPAVSDAQSSPPKDSRHSPTDQALALSPTPGPAAARAAGSTGARQPTPGASVVQSTQPSPRSAAVPSPPEPLPFMTSNPYGDE